MSEKPKDNRPMTLGEVSQYLRYSEKTVVKLAHDGTLPAVKCGKEWRFDADRIRSLDFGKGKK